MPKVQMNDDEARIWDSILEQGEYKLAGNEYAWCESCEGLTMTVSVCVDDGRHSGPWEHCYPAEYEEQCKHCGECR